MSRLARVDGHDRDETALLDERHTDEAADRSRAEGLLRKFGGGARVFGDVVDDDDLAGLQVGDEIHAEIGKPVRADIAGHGPCVPFARDRRKSFAGVDFRIDDLIAAGGRSQPFAGGRHDSDRIALRFEAVGEFEQEALSLLAFDQRPFRPFLFGDVALHAMPDRQPIALNHGARSSRIHRTSPSGRRIGISIAKSDFRLMLTRSASSNFGR